MSARVFLHAGATIDTAGPVTFDPPVKVTRSGFYVLNLEGDAPTLEPVAESPWKRLELELDRLDKTAINNGEVWSVEECSPSEWYVRYQDVQALVRKAQDG